MDKIFTSDWFGRNNANFTTKNTTLSIGWDTNMTKYSQFLYNLNRAKEIIYNDDELKRELYTLLRSLSVNAIVSIVTQPNLARTNGRVIELSKHFSGVIEDEYDRLDVVIGLLLHEACHCKWTNFGYMKREIDKLNKIVHQIHNIIEDEMIETRMGMKNPGYVNFLQKVKYYFFNEFAHDISDEPTNNLDYIFKILLAVIRYPDLLKTIPDEILDKHANLFANIKNICDITGVFDKDETIDCTKISIRAAFGIYELLKQYIKQNPDATKDSENEDENGEGNGQGGDGCGQSSDNNDETKNGESSEDNGDDKTNSGFQKNAMSDKDAEEILNEYGNDEKTVLSKLDVLMSQIESSSEKGTLKTMYRFDDELTQVAKKEDLTKFDMGPASADIEMSTDIYESSRSKYYSFFNVIKKYIKDFKNIAIKNEYDIIYKQIQYQRNGSLDSARLADAMQNVQSVYKRTIPQQKECRPHYAVALLLDESGSMDGGGCSIRTSELAILMYEALSQYRDIELYVYGHGDVINRYIDKHNKNKYVLGSRRSQWNQNEELTYKMIIEDIRKQTKLPIIAINITDSFYLANVDNMKKIMDDFRDNKVFFNCINVQHECNIDYVKETNDTLYGEHGWAAFNCSEKDPFKKLITDFAQVIKTNIDVHKL